MSVISHSERSTLSLFQRSNRPNHDSGSRLRRAVEMLSVGALALVIVACGADSGPTDDNRQFANEVATRTPDTEATVTPTPILDVDATPDVAEATPIASPEALLRSRGAPETLYTLVDGHLLSLSVRDGATVPSPIDIASDHTLLAFDASPAGNRVAVLLADQEGAVTLTILSREGETLQGPLDVLRGGSATPASSDDRSPHFLVDWGPQGSEIVVSDGWALESVTLSGQVESIPLDDFDGQLRTAGLSPQGSRIVLQFQSGDGAQQVFVRDIVTGKTRELRALSTKADEGITNLQWLPNGAGLVFVSGSLDRGVVVHGQLRVYRLGQERSDLIATPGRGGPSATITDAVVSPDGHSVAYVISLLDGSRWSFHSMWVRSMDGSQTFQVPAVSRGVVGHVAWVNGGISWEQRRESSAPGQILVTGESGLPMVVFNKGTTSLFSTPAASPVASPDTTRSASPAGTPPDNPLATPVGTP